MQLKHTLIAVSIIAAFASPAFANSNCNGRDNCGDTGGTVVQANPMANAGASAAANASPTLTANPMANAGSSSGSNSDAAASANQKQIAEGGTGVGVGVGMGGKGGDGGNAGASAQNSTNVGTSVGVSNSNSARTGDSTSIAGGGSAHADGGESKSGAAAISGVGDTGNGNGATVSTVNKNTTLVMPTINPVGPANVLPGQVSVFSTGCGGRVDVKEVDVTGKKFNLVAATEDVDLGKTYLVSPANQSFVVEKIGGVDYFMGHTVQGVATATTISSASSIGLFGGSNGGAGGISGSQSAGMTRLVTQVFVQSCIYSRAVPLESCMAKRDGAGVKKGDVLEYNKGQRPAECNGG